MWGSDHNPVIKQDQINFSSSQCCDAGVQEIPPRYQLFFIFFTPPPPPPRPAPHLGQDRLNNKMKHNWDYSIYDRYVRVNIFSDVLYRLNTVFGIATGSLILKARKSNKKNKKQTNTQGTTTCSGLRNEGGDLRERTLSLVNPVVYFMWSNRARGHSGDPSTENCTDLIHRVRFFFPLSSVRKQLDQKSENPPTSVEQERKISSLGGLHLKQTKK